MKTLKRIAIALEGIHQELTRIKLAEGPCDGTMAVVTSYAKRPDIGKIVPSSTIHYACELTYGHTGLHKDANATWGEEQNKTLVHPGGRPPESL